MAAIVNGRWIDQRRPLPAVVPHSGASIHSREIGTVSTESRTDPSTQATGRAEHGAGEGQAEALERDGHVIRRIAWYATRTTTAPIIATNIL
jgi:hypothetical protein